MGTDAEAPANPELARLTREQSQQKKKLEQERIDQERARFSGGGSLLTPDQKLKQTQQSQLGG